MPHRFVRAVMPIVEHGLRELSVEGADIQHTLHEVALMGALVGTGVAANQAIRQVEAQEAQLLGMPRAEAYETMYHPGLTGTGMYGKPAGKGMMPSGQTMAPYGKGMGKGTYGKGKGTPGMGMGTYGMTPYTTSPYMGGVRY